MGGNHHVEDEVPTAKLHVVCRVRPMSEHEKRSGTVPCVTASTERSEVSVVRTQPGSTTRQVKSNFNFDNVLTSFSTQSDVFAVTLKPLIREVLCGYEAAAFAYGQTGTGKTYTMEGNLEAEEDMGLVPRASAALIQAISVGSYLSSTITASCLEIYNEELTDLLIQQGQQQQKLDLKETGRGVACIGLSEIPVSSADDVQELICLAQDRRRIAETRVNARSSRSHTLFTLRVCIRQRVQGGEVENIGKLHLVDLAGSECAKKACLNEVVRSGTFGGGSTAEAERERRNINQSLLTLGRVIAALRDESSRVPYRDSKLTRLLQDALGGSCRTVMIATISPAQAAVDETISTLAYAEQAMGIQNRPVAASTLVVRAPSGDVNSMAANGICPAVNVMEGGETEMRLAYLTQEVEECKAALTRKIRESEELNRQMDEAEAKFAVAAAELKDQRVAVAERDFILSHTAAYADRRLEDARCLAAALGSSQGREKTLEDGLRRSNSLASSVREQARSLHATATEHLDLLCSSGGGACTETLSASIELANDTWRKPLNILREAFNVQQHLIEGLVSEVRCSGEKLSELLSSSCEKAKEATASENAENTERLAVIGGAVSTAVAVAEKHRASAKEAASQCEMALTKQAESLNSLMLSNAHDVQEATTRLASELEETSHSAASAQSDANEHLSNGVCKAVAHLGEELRGLKAETERHADSLSAARVRAAGDSTAAAARRASINEAIQSVGDGHAAAVASTTPPLSDALQTLREKLAERHACVSERVRSVGAQLDDISQHMDTTCTQGEAAVRTALMKGDQHLTSAWADVSRCLASVISSMQEHANADSAAQHDDTSLKQDRDSVTLADALVAAVAELDAAHEQIAKEVADLRQHRQIEEKAISMLSQQRGELEDDISRMQASLGDLSSDLERARSELETVEAEQSRCREDAVQSVLTGVETLLRGGIESIADNLKEHSSVVRCHLDRAKSRCSASSALAVSAQERCTSTGDKVSQAVTSWASASDAVCDHITLAQTTSQNASRQVYTKATENISEIVADLGRLRAAQDEVQPKWAGYRDDAVAAVASWCESEKGEVSTLRDAYSQNASVLEEAMALQREVHSQCNDAALQVAERARKDQQHVALLAALRQLHAESSPEDDAAAAHQHGVLSSLGEGAMAIAEASELRIPEADAALEAGKEHLRIAAVMAEAHGTALQTAKANVVQLAAQAKATNEQLVLQAIQLRAGGSKACQEAVESADETAQEVASALEPAKCALDTQHVAFSAADAAKQELWLQLGQGHSNVLKAAELAAAAAHAESASVKDKAEARDEEDIADVAHRKAVDELKDHCVRLRKALTEHQHLWHAGLAAVPMQAFAEESIFEDELTRDIPSEVVPLPEHILADISDDRPTEKALSAEFYASHGSNSDLPKSGMPKEDESSVPLETPRSSTRVETPRRRSPSNKAGGKQTVEEAAGYPRMALRELQVGGMPLVQ